MSNEIPAGELPGIYIGSFQITASKDEARIAFGETVSGKTHWRFVAVMSRLTSRSFVTRLTGSQELNNGR